MECEPKYIISVYAGKDTIQRYRAVFKILEKDLYEINGDPIPYVWIRPNPKNFLQWHFVIQGMENTPYEGGYYHGKLYFSEYFPYKPPKFIIYTPNGRFQINKPLIAYLDCVPQDNEYTFQQYLTVRSFMTALIVHWLDYNIIPETTLKSTLVEKRRLAAKSIVFNLNNEDFLNIFYDKCADFKKFTPQKYSNVKYLFKNFFFNTECIDKN